MENEQVGSSVLEGTLEFHLVDYFNDDTAKKDMAKLEEEYTRSEKTYRAELEFLKSF